MLGAILSNNTNRTQAQTPAKAATHLTAERKTRQVYTSRGGWARDHLNARGGHGSLTTDGCYFLADVVCGHGGQNQRENRRPLSRSRRNIANSQGGSRLSHCKATNPKRHRHHRPAGRRAKRALADHFTGRRRTVTHADGLQEFRSATGHRTRPRSR